jgi:hypothetical protein
MRHEDIKKSTVKMVLNRKIGTLFATGGSVHVFMTTRKVYKRLSNCMWTFMTTSLEELITRVLLGRPKRTLGQKLNIFRTSVKKDGAGRLEIQILCYEERPTDVRALTGKREKGGLAQEEPLGGVVEECLASQLT